MLQGGLALEEEVDGFGQGKRQAGIGGGGKQRERERERESDNDDDDKVRQGNRGMRQGGGGLKSRISKVDAMLSSETAMRAERFELPTF